MKKLEKPFLKNYRPKIKVLGIDTFLIVFLALIFCMGLREDPKNPWVKIDGGEFEMGDRYCQEEQGNSDWCHDEVPHLVRLDDFSINRYEVTNDQYYQCFKAGSCSPNDLHEFRPREFTDREQPVIFVSWEQAATFCEWIGGRLPTEAEWEFSADTEELGGAHFGKKYEKGAPLKVGKLKFNSRGLYDMLGNVSEWVQDWYGFYESETLQINPKGPVKGKEKIVRGGAWISPAYYIRASDRISRTPELRYSDVGFRCVKSLNP